MDAEHRPRGDAAATGYRLTPFAERWGDVDWRAGVILNVDAARGTRETKSTYCKPFASKEEALRFARMQCERATGGVRGPSTRSSDDW